MTQHLSHQQKTTTSAGNISSPEDRPNLYLITGLVTQHSSSNSQLSLSSPHRFRYPVLSIVYQSISIVHQSISIARQSLLQSSNSLSQIVFFQSLVVLKVLIDSCF
ncbi:hypothetical protein H4Q26_016877 [Puccinia striiformis f. sp. tritici PST-130]|nr:hypothetical protein H4Q26_016877 [Puccinia striiformis f. sp. tritici PST-130]